MVVEADPQGVPPAATEEPQEEPTQEEESDQAPTTARVSLREVSENLSKITGSVATLSAVVEALAHSIAADREASKDFAPAIKRLISLSNAKEEKLKGSEEFALSEGATNDGTKLDFTSKHDRDITRAARKPLYPDGEQKFGGELERVSGFTRLLSGRGQDHGLYHVQQGILHFRLGDTDYNVVTDIDKLSKEVLKTLSERILYGDLRRTRMAQNNNILLHILKTSLTEKFRSL